MALDAAGNPILDSASISSIQSMLGVPVTGVWDGATRTAFNSFQSAKGWGLTYGLTGDANEWSNLIDSLKNKNTAPAPKNLDGSTTPVNIPSAPSTPAAPPNPNGTPEQQSAKDMISKTLSDWGLQSLTDWAWQQIVQGNANILPTLIRGTQEYKQRFAGNAARVAAGYNALSEADYLQLENNYRYLMTQYGVPKGFYDSQNEMAQLIGGNVSPSELNSRLQMYSDAASKAPVEVRNELQRLYGVTDGEMTAFFIDPNTALPLIEQRYNAVGAAASADRAGFASIAKDTAERLASLGASNNQSTFDTFSKLSRSTELFTPLSGENIMSNGTMSSDQAAVASFGGDSMNAELLRKRGEQRAAEYQGGGQYASTKAGVVGLSNDST